ncbi:fasciclin domain-containing protein [Allomuricauda sp. d1]|uniref:fasciclin domain-containing protein n=1 Tax=Allomuricauda sp. d1 TaxID=3136725 RepID=UPI0031DBBDAF
MKSPLSKFGLIAIAVLSFLVFSCNKNDDDGSMPTEDVEGGTTDDMPDDGQGGEALPNIVALAQSESSLSNLVAALSTADADLVETLSAEGTFTVFAPSNDAFDALLGELDGFSSLDDFDEDDEKALLAEILKYHVISGTATFSDGLSEGIVLTTLQTEELTVNVDASIFIEDKTDVAAEVTGADNEASNGVVHIIDKILLPDAVLEVIFPKPSIPELIQETEELSLLLEAVEKAGLTEDLSADGPFTVFAPSNEAIQELFDLLGEGFANFDDFDNAIEILILQDLLKYHIVASNTLSTDLAAGNVPTLLDGESLEIIASGDEFTIGDATDEDANLTSIDNEAANGVVHIVDKVLIPQFVLDFLDDNGGQATSKSISDLVTESEDFSLLKEALELTGLLDTLDGEGPFTVFAPSQEAFEQLFFIIGASNINSLNEFDTELEIGLLRTVLSYHVSPVELTSNSFSETDLGTLSSGDNLHLVNRDGEFVLVDAVGLDIDFELNDIPAGNGVIHIVDRVLVPQSVIELVLDESTIALMDFLDQLDREDVYALVCMLGNQYEEVLQSDFTFFLPTNQAFLNLFDSLDGINSIADFDTQEELELLATILSYHFVPDSTFTSDALVNCGTMETFQGETLEVRMGEDGAYILDKSGAPSKVTSVDNTVLNGVIHFIDKVLLPNEVLNQL